MPKGKKATVLPTKSAVIAENEDTPQVVSTDLTTIAPDEALDQEEDAKELEDWLKDLLENTDDTFEVVTNNARLIETIDQNVTTVMTMFKTLVSVIQKGGAMGTTQPAEIADRDIVIKAQHKIIRSIIENPKLDVKARTSIATSLRDLPDWEVMEAAQSRL